MSAVVLLLLEIPTLPPGLVGYGRYLATWTDLPHFLYVGEGMTASVAVSESDQGVRSFHVSGKVVASTSPEDMRLQRMLGHLPALVDAHPRSVLVVGCGAGVTAGSLTVHPGVERIVVCEIEPLIPPAAKAYFGSENHDVLDDPRVEVVTDDARHYVLTTNERFDVITSDPIHPWVKGAAALYSEEFFRECRAKLTPGGVVAQWVPLYETSPEAVKSELATFFDVFPDGTLWANEKEGEGYDLVVVGPTEPATIDLAEWEARLALPEEAGVRESLQEVGLGSALKLLSTYAGRGSTLRPWWRDAPRNHDADLRLQYLAGLGVNEDDADGIYRSLLVYRHYPDGAVRASGPDAAALVDVLRRRRAQPVQKSD